MADNQENKYPSPSTPSFMPPCYFGQSAIPSQRDDEVSLVDLVGVLLKRWKWVVFFTVLALGLAVVYLFLVTPLYLAEKRMLPPATSHVQLLNITGINEFARETSVDEVRREIYQEFVRNLKSRSLRWNFFEENNLAAILAKNSDVEPGVVFREKFNAQLRVRQGAGEEEGVVLVSFRGSDPKLAADWVNGFVELAAQSTVESVVESVRTRIVNERETIQERIRIERDFAELRRLDRIEVLNERVAIAREQYSRQDRIDQINEQIAIARELNIFTRDDAPLKGLEGGALGVAVSTVEGPRYLRGVEELVAEVGALQQREDDDSFVPDLRDFLAEKNALQKRENDDPFIDGLRENQIRIDRLDSGLMMLQIAKAGMSAARVDQIAVPPADPFKPNKKMVLLLALVAGGVLGVVAAAVAEFTATLKRRAQPF